MIETQLDSWNDASLSSVMYSNLYELGINIEQHAERPGFLAAQHYPKIRAVRFAIGDWGVGIPGSLAAAGKMFASPIQAVREAATTRLSRFDKDRGFGLQSTIRDLRFRGTVEIRSGGAHLTWAMAKASASTDALALPGTLIYAQMRW